MLLAHIMGIPVEESLASWMSGGVGVTVLAMLVVFRAKVRALAD